MYVTATIGNISLKSTECVDTIKESGKLVMELCSDPTVTIMVEPKKDKLATLLFTFEGGTPWNLHHDISCRRIQIVDSLLKLVDCNFGWKGLPTYKLGESKFSPLGIFKNVYVDGDQLLLDWGLDTTKPKEVRPMLTLREVVEVNGYKGHVLGGEFNNKEVFYTSWSGKTQKANVTLSVYKEAFKVVNEPKIDFYQPVNIRDLVFNDIPFVSDSTLFTRELYNSYSMQRVKLGGKGKHMTLVDDFDAYVFKSYKDAKMSADDGLHLHEVVAPEWAKLPVGSGGSLPYTSLYALSYDDVMSSSMLDKLGCVLARELWNETGKTISDDVVYPETIIYRAGVPVKYEYEHKFVTPTSNESPSLISITGGSYPLMYIVKVCTVIDRSGNDYISVRYFNYATNQERYVSTQHLNAIMNMDRDERFKLMEKHSSGAYSYEGLDYDEVYIKFPESKYAYLFADANGVPSFPTMYANVYDKLPDSLKSLESANCIEEVCEFYYTSEAADN